MTGPVAPSDWDLRQQGVLFAAFRRCTHQMDSAVPNHAFRQFFVGVLPAWDECGYHRHVSQDVSATIAPMAEPVEPRGPVTATTVELLSRARAGDSSALDALMSRSLPPLRRWARGRLPAGARGLLETQDLVQDTVLKALQRLDRFESRHQGALQAYLRQAVLNRIRDEARKLARRPAPAELDEQYPSAAASPLDVAVGREGVERYEVALQRLRPADREAVVGRLELQYDYEELADILNKPNANAARVAVTRAIARLVEQMDYDG